MPRCQDIKISSRARSILSICLASPGLPGVPKITHFCTQIPRWPDITITYYLSYKSYVFMMPKPPKIAIFWYPKGGKPAAKQPSWSQDAKMQPKQHSSKVASQQLSSQAGAKMPRYKDFFPRARHFVHFPRIPTFAGNLENHSFLHSDTEMARYHDNRLFPIQKLCFHDAKAT